MVVRTENLNDGRHVVQFYGRDRELAERVAGFLREGLERGGAAFVATPEHRRGFEARLAEAGLDLQVDAFAEVCRLHEEIVMPGETAGPKPGVPGAVRTFAFARDAPALARHFAVATLHGWGAGDVADDAALVVTELAANAILHAHTAFTVILSARADLLRISVRDASPLHGELRPAPLHGLGAVDAMASRWGVESLGNAGKTVWVDLHR